MMCYLELYWSTIISVETVLAIDSNKGLILKTITNELELIDQKLHKNQLEWNKYGERAKAGLGGLYLSPYFACFDFWWLPKIHTKKMKNLHCVQM